jgi:hypothetical protein
MSGIQEQGSEESSWSEGYGGFRGNDEYAERGRGQKLDVDGDEMFADMLMKRIRQEGQANDSQTRAEVAKTNVMRMWVGIISVIALIPMFITLAVTLSLGDNPGAAMGLGWGFVAACAVLFAVNAYFNWASIEMSRHIYGSRQKDVPQAERGRHTAHQRRNHGIES